MVTDVKNQVRIAVRTDTDLMRARQESRRIAGDMGFAPVDITCVVTAISELARNILQYAKSGEIRITYLNEPSKRGIQIVARDRGPGILDIRQAMQDGFSTSGGLGLGLPGVRRLVDEFKIESKVGRGTTVTVKKWVT